MKLILENVRTFVGRHEIPIRPLTVLIGENSTGKTTLLAMLAAISNNEKFPFQPIFNTPPFSLGNYDNIAAYRNGKHVSPSFAIGLTREQPEDHELAEARAEYASNGGYPYLSSFEARAREFHLSVNCSAPQQEKISLTYSLAAGKHRFGPEKLEIGSSLAPDAIPRLVFLALTRRDNAVLAAPEEVVRRSLNLTRDVAPLQVLPVAPIRTKPERVYTEMQEAFSPAGEHIPFLLEQLLRTAGGKSKRALDALAAFGNESALFTSVSVRHLGKKPGEPFQVTVSIAGHHINLVDVGYGVSQVLPVIVQTVLAPKDKFLLMQQPEVHLHPKAQAALGSFFSRMAGAGESHMIVETHSDYIIDRIRQEVAKKTIGPEKVAIIYFQKRKLRTSCHLLELDEQANFVNVPPDYRQFFLDESLNLLKAGC